MTRQRAATTGTFDGVHLGHRVVVETVAAIARRKRLEPTVITFDRHPLMTIAPHRAPQRIMTPEREREELERLGVSVIVLPFTEELRRLTAREWMQRMAADYGVRALVMGYDNTFGCDGIGMDAADYRAIGAAEGIDVSEAALLPEVSSTAIRRALAAGDAARAAAMLGRPFEITGSVAHGDALGRTIGRPTANLTPRPGMLIPAAGAYAILADVPGQSRPLPALLNIGRRPTVGGETLRIEAHILDFAADLYDKQLTVKLIDRLRDERRFDSIAALSAQIDSDEARARMILESHRS